LPKTRHAAYRNVKSNKVEIDGIKFASPGEAERWLELCIMQLQGKITEIIRQPGFELQPAFRKCCGRIWVHNESDPVYKKGKCPVCGEKMPVSRNMRYIADFKITYSDGETVIEDVKGWGGYTTPDFKNKKKLFEFKYPALSLVLLKRTGSQKNRDRLMAERAALK
jgi:hypothetical protein